jgi:hypothetical protein
MGYLLVVVSRNFSIGEGNDAATSPGDIFIMGYQHHKTSEVLL